MATTVVKGFQHSTNIFRKERRLRNVAIETQDVRAPMKTYINQKGKASSTLMKWAWGEGRQLEQFISTMNSIESSENTAVHQYIAEYIDFYRGFQNLLQKKEELHSMESDYVRTAKALGKWNKKVNKIDRKLRTTPVLSSKVPELKMKLEHAKHHAEEAARDRNAVEQRLVQKNLSVQKKVHDVLRKRYFKLCMARINLMRKSSVLYSDMLDRINDLQQVTELTRENGFLYGPYPTKLTIPVMNDRGEELTGKDIEQPVEDVQFNFNLKPTIMIESAKEGLHEDLNPTDFVLQQANYVKALVEHVLKMLESDALDQVQSAAMTVNLTTHISNLLISVSGASFVFDQNDKIISLAFSISEQASAFLDEWAQEHFYKHDAITEGSTLLDSLHQLIAEFTRLGKSIEGPSAEEEEFLDFKKKAGEDISEAKECLFELKYFIDQLTMEEQMAVEPAREVRVAKLNLLHTASKVIECFTQCLSKVKSLEDEMLFETEGHAVKDDTFRVVSQTNRLIMDARCLCIEIIRKQKDFSVYMINVMKDQGSYEELQVLVSALAAYMNKLVDTLQEQETTEDEEYITIEGIAFGDAIAKLVGDFVDDIRECLSLSQRPKKEGGRQWRTKDETGISHTDKTAFVEHEIETIKQALNEAKEYLAEVRGEPEEQALSKRKPGVDASGGIRRRRAVAGVY